MLNWLKNYLIKDEVIALEHELAYRTSQMKKYYHEKEAVMMAQMSMIDRENRYLVKLLTDVKIFSPVPPFILKKDEL